MNNEEVCENCLYYRGEYHERIPRGPDRYGISCQKWGILIRQIGGDSATPYTCVSYEEAPPAKEKAVRHD